MCVPMCYVLKLLSIVSNSIMDCVRSSLSLQLWGVFCTGRRPRLFWSRVPYQTPPSRLPRPGAKPFPSPVSSLVSSITSATAAMPLGFHPDGDRGCGDRGGELGGAGPRRGGSGGKARFCWVHGSRAGLVPLLPRQLAPVPPCSGLAAGYRPPPTPPSLMQPPTGRLS